jgi:probable rRNA maturation factor
MKPTIINDSGMEISEEILLKWVKGITAELLKKKVLTPDKKEKELGLVFLNENDAKKLNWNYRCKDYPTDILSFDSEDPTALGELVLCPQVITKQAKEHGISVEEEFGYTILHGVLHLLGFDHEKNKENEAVMMGLQDEVFETIRNPKKALKAAAVKTSEKTVAKKEEKNVKAAKVTKVKVKEDAKPKKTATKLKVVAAKKATKANNKKKK